MLALSVLVLAIVLWYWLRKIARAHIALASILETTVNTLAVRNGQPPITDDESAERLRRRL